MLKLRTKTELVLNSVINEVFTTEACLDDKTRYVCIQVVGQTRGGRWSESLIHKHSYFHNLGVLTNNRWLYKAAPWLTPMLDSHFMGWI
jgi:hypothetical protein